MIRRFLTLILSLCCFSSAHAQTWQDVVAKVQAGTPVKVGILGNSVGCGQTATGFNTGTMLNSTYANAITGVSAASMLTSFGPHDPVEGWVNQLYAYLLTKNASTVVINLSGSGWDTGDQLGVESANSGKTPVHNNVSTFVNMAPKPDVVLLPLQINDWGHNQGLTFFNTNTASIVSQLQAAGIVVIMVKESPIYNRPETNVSGAYTADRANYPNDYNFTLAASTIATSNNLGVMDLFAPLDTAIKSQSGTYYGNKMCNSGLFADGCPSCPDSGNACPVHPNQAGHDIMATAAISFFQQTVSVSPGSSKSTATLRANLR